MLVKWGIRVSDVHYVEPPNDRVVTDLTVLGANASSPESEHGYAKERVQLVEEMATWIWFRCSRMGSWCPLRLTSSQPL